MTRRPDQLKELTRYEIANVFMIHPNDLSGKFKNATGRTVLEFINFEKMKRAEKRLITCKDLTIAEISNSAGYAKYDQFRKAFKKTFTLNPRLYRKIKTDPDAAETAKHKYLFESVAIYIITRNLDQLSRLTRNDLAQTFQMNQNHLGAIFKKGAQKTVFNFIQFEKMKRAEVLLTTRHDLKVKQIAQMVGIPNCKRFRKKFSRIYGLNPCKYRLLHKS